MRLIENRRARTAFLVFVLFTLLAGDAWRYTLGWVGWGALVVGAFAGFLLGGIFAIVLVVTRRANRKSGIPFGPWMLAGAWTGIFFGNLAWNGYLSFVGLVAS